MDNSNSSFKLIIILAVGVGALLMFFLHLILTTPNGIVGVFH